MNRKLMFSSERDDWCTPQSFFDELNKEFGFTLDPCATKLSAKCENFYTKKDDGLSKDWYGEVVFVNPPYGREMKKWVNKCFEESKKPNTKVVMLIPARTDTTYFHEYIYKKAEIRFIRGRVKFIKPDTSTDEKDFTSAPFPSMVVVF